MAKLGKGDVVDRIAQRSGATKAAAAMAVDAVLDGVQDVLSEGHELTIPGFGTFKVSNRSGKGPTGDNYSTNVVSFKAGSKLKAAVND